TSFTHHPFYSQFILEVPDNWMWGTVYNLPLDEMMAVIDHALATGHPVAWGTDVSEKGFSRSLALGIVPEADLDSMSGTEAERWGKLTQREKEAALYKFEKPGKERVITQQMRQEAFDNYETTDDHGMVIVGTAHDQAGNAYYKVLNSWDVRPPYDGYYYFSRPFVAYKTTDIMVNKKALPKEIAKKLGVK
ncbi:MAG: C1 family peptidase, partial [Alistipes sp.]|nr:C1 family peptidase [Alistipes sp.]